MLGGADIAEAADRDWTVYAPSLVDRMPDDVYHADPVVDGSISHSLAKKMLPPSCPARARWAADHPEFKDAFDKGTVTHRLILGVGQDIHEVKYDSWRTNAAKAERDEARARGAVPLLSADLAECEAMAAAVRRHPLAAALLEPDGGQPEQSLFWLDPATDVWRRARIDMLRPHGAGHSAQPIAVDVKTTTSVELDDIEKAIWRNGYYQQDAWYVDGLTALGFDEPDFLFVFVEKDPPHLVRVARVPWWYRQAGRARNAAAIRLWAQCVETGDWPGYPLEINEIDAPRWAQLEEYA